MGKRELQDFEIIHEQAFAALERRKAAADAVLARARAANRSGFKGPPAEELVSAVTDWEQADADFRAAQQALDERARKR